MGLELVGVPERCVQTDELADRRLHLADGAAAQLVARLHRRAVLQDEREPPVVVDGGVRAARRVDGDLRREVLVEAELVAVAARRHELAGRRILRRELADHAARRAGHLAVEPERGSRAQMPIRPAPTVSAGASTTTASPIRPASRSTSVRNSAVTSP